MTTRQSDPTSAEARLQVTLTQTKGRNLLAVYASLTHQIHASRDGDDRARHARRKQAEETAALREQRDRVAAEILRRMGETP